MTTTAPPVVYRGSVKDVLGPVSALGAKGEPVAATVFRYMDSFSVFDWGRMPDHLHRKGSALAVLAADLFEKLESASSWREFSKSPEAQALRRGVTALQAEPEGGSRFGHTTSVGSVFNELGEKLQGAGLRTHYLGVFEGEDFPAGPIQAKSLARSSEPMRYLVVRHVQVVRPQFKKIMGRAVPDYENYRAVGGAKLLPLEVVFRFSCPSGSSLLDRVARDPSLLKSLPLPKAVVDAGLQPGTRFEFPLVELFTKLESTDRPVSMSEGLAMTGLKPELMQELLLRTAWVAGFLRHQAAKAGLDLADGKLEWALNENGELLLVDAIGPDELRLLAQSGFQVSKEFLRQFYRATEWYKTIQDSKLEAIAKGVSDWKKLVKDQPPALSPKHKEVACQLYWTLTNQFTGKPWFPDAWSLDGLVDAMKGLES